MLPLLLVADAVAPPLIESTSTLMSLFVQHVAPVLFIGLAGLVGWVFTQLGRKFGADASDSKLSKVLTRLAHLGDVVVAELDATLRPELEKATADGVLTKAEIAQLRDVALAKLKAIAGERGLEEARALIGIALPQFDQYLHGVLERAVDRLGNAKTPEVVAISATPVSVGSPPMPLSPVR